LFPHALLAAYATGIGLGGSVDPVPPAALILAVISLLLTWLALHRSAWGWLPFLCLLAAAGFLNASLQLTPPSTPGHISGFAGGPAVNLEGYIQSVEDRPTGGQRLFLAMHRATTSHGARQVYGRLLLLIREGSRPFRPGQFIRWRSDVRRPGRFGNPGEFDYPLYLAAQGIHVTALVARPDQVIVLINHSAGPGTLPARWRHDLAAYIKQAVPDRAAGLLQALLLGIRGGITEEHRQLLAGGGVAHLFAISGLHFGLLALFLYQVGRWFYSCSSRLLLWCPPQKVLPLILTLPLTAYLLLTGNAWATRRAFLTVTLIALLYSRGRRTPPLTLLATVAGCMLLADPLALFQPGFQLSFCGIAGIMIWWSWWRTRLAPLPGAIRWPINLLLTTVAASLATAPVTLWHFHQFAPAGVVTNLFAIPMIAWGAVPTGLLSLFFIPFSPAVADCGLMFAAWLVNLALDLVERISCWPGLAPIALFLTTADLLLMVGALLACLPLGRRPRHHAARVAIMLAAMTTAWLTSPQIEDFRVVAVSVGQGDATLISLAGNRHYLIDGGGWPGSPIDPGERLLAPALGRLGITRLQGVILSHNHPDHSLGLAAILKRFPAAGFYLSGETAALPADLQSTLRQRGVPVHSLDPGWITLAENGTQTLRLFVPEQSTADVNERSIAVFAGQQGQGVLLTADLGRNGLQQLLEAGLPGPVTLLKLPHHGSRHACPELFLERLQPDLAFVSAGLHNPYGFPHQQTVAACAAHRVQLHRTDQEGMLTFRLHNGAWRTGRVKAL
jgi:competence protein ComEC